MTMIPIDPRRSQTTTEYSSSTPSSKVSNNSSTGKWRKALFGVQTLKPTISVCSNTSCHNAQLDLTYLTSRLIVMSTPRDQIINGSSRSVAQLVADFLDKNHGDFYEIYSLDKNSSGQNSYRKELFHNRVIEMSLFDGKRPPNLLELFTFAEKIRLDLSQSTTKIAVLHCSDGKNLLAFASCALIALEKVFDKIDQIFSFYEYRRGSLPSLTNSQKKSIQYLSDLAFGIIEKPHFEEILLENISLQPIPVFNREKTGCRPFVDIFNDQNKKIFSTYQDAKKLPKFTKNEENCSIPIQLKFLGEIFIRISHAPVGASLQAVDGGIPICHLRFNSNFSTEKNRKIFFSKNELEGIEQEEKYSPSFQVILQTNSTGKTSTEEQISRAKQFQLIFQQSNFLFQDENDRLQTIDDFQKCRTVPGNYSSPAPSPGIRRSINGKDDQLTPNAPSNSSSPIQSQRVSSTSYSNPQSPSCVVNPNYQKNPFQQIRNQSPRTLQMGSSVSPVKSLSPSTSIPSSPNPELISSTNSANFTSPHRDSSFEKSTSSEVPSNDFTTAFQSRINLLDDEIFPDLPKTNSTSSDPSKSNTFNVHPDLLDIDERTDPSTTLQVPKNSPNESEKSDEIDSTRVLKIRQWTEGKKRNIRALLCSLSTVTWSECGWKGCQMHEVVTADQVKKAYHNAVRYMHPDKLRGDANEPLAKLIFVELNEAWSQFEQELNR